MTIFDDRGKSYLDALSGLFTVQVGHGRTELAEVAARQASTLAYFPLWGYATPTAIELAERLARYAPGDLNRVFFTSGGTEAVETAWKLAKQYFKLTGKPGKHKVISRSIAYHGTTQGALAITGLPSYKAPFEPVTPGGFRVPNTNFYRAPDPFAHDPKAFGQWAADRIAEAIEFEGPATVAAVFLEPVQNAGGSIPPPPGYFERVREICDSYDVLLVSDEVICAFGRIGSMFACDDFGYVPDMITCAKGLTSGYSPLGAMIASERLFEPFNDGATDVPARLYLWRPSGFGRRRAGQPRHLRARGPQRPRQDNTRPPSAPPWRSCTTCPSSATSAARGTSTASNWSRTRRPSRPSATTERRPLLRPRVVGALRGRAVLPHRRPRRFRRPVAPPLISGQAEFDTIESILRGVLTRSPRRL